MGNSRTIYVVCFQSFSCLSGRALFASFCFHFKVDLQSTGDHQLQFFSFIDTDKNVKTVASL